MTEADWLVCENPEEMYFEVIGPLKRSRRRNDLFCLARGVHGFFLAGV